MTLFGWLLLFTFGLGGVRPLVFGVYASNPTLMYINIACGLAAIVFCLYTFQKVPVIETLKNDTLRELYNRVPIDIRLLVAFICLISTLAKLNGGVLNLPFYAINYAQFLVTTTLFVTATMIQVLLLSDVLRNKNLRASSWYKSVAYLFISSVRNSFLCRNVGIRLFWTLGVFFASGFGIMVVLFYHQALVFYVPLFLVITLPTLIVVFRHAGYFNLIVESTSRLVEGGTPDDLPVKGLSGLATLAGNVNRLKHGVEVSQVAQAKSERLKTDLITNVSHDLRTPLTSIITYTELLKNPNLDESERVRYVDVLDQKSKRLKILIDDLFEASKMASGNAELTKERVDITQLLQQALAERDEAIVASALDFRVSKPDSPVYCVVDGQKMWRVFDNLLGNILKYSLDHTRVYISVETLNLTTILVFKNIANYELNGEFDELLERFKRGDDSRHTEGSGLGLAIAKSIVDLHGGTFRLDIDGDLFKATITIPDKVEV